MAYLEFGEVGNLVDVDTTVALWERVVLREKEGGQYLVSDGACVGVIKPPTVDYNFMLSLINLVRPPSMSASFEDLVETISSEAAAEWIQRNGFPEVEYYYLDGAYAWLSLSRFRRQVVTLYLLFHLWQALLYDNEREVDRYLRPLAARDISGLSFRHKKIIAQQFISNLIDQRLREMQPRFSAYLPSPKILLHTSNLFSVAYFQLATLITRETQGEPEKKKHLKVCPDDQGGCGNLFWGHGNRRFCPNCDRRTAYSRRRKRNKNNGQ